jgi:ribosomal protein S18 acetylase RimI-like enzyme
MIMSAITQPLTLTSNGLRPFDIARDLKQVADLVESCFAGTLDEDGQAYVQNMRASARNAHFLRWAAAVADSVPLPLSGFVWEENGRLVGNLSLIPFTVEGKRGYLIANVAVDPAFRRRGIARNLTTTAMHHIQKRGFSSIWLHVRDDNQPAQQLYLSLGFEERARRTTWESKARTSVLLEHFPPTPTPGMIISHPRPADWVHQRQWLQQTYPPELSWHLPLDLNSMRPTWTGALQRMFTGVQLQQWAAYDQQLLIGVLSWQPRSNHAGVLWLAADPARESEAIVALFTTVRRQLNKHPRLVLDYPAGRSTQAFQQVGLVNLQTLIWMEANLSGFTL